MANNTTITTGKVRFSYCHLNAPVKALGSDREKYGMSVIIPKSDKTTVAAVKSAIDEAKKIGASSKWGGKIPGNVRSPLRDGDTDRPNDEAYAGSYFFNCSANADRRPRLFDANVQEILDPMEVYSGCWGRVNVNFYPYDVNGNRGVGVGLNLVQKLEDGEALGGSTPSAMQAFGDGLLD